MAITNKGGGSLPIDASGKPIPVASSTQQRDGTATALESPVTVSATASTITIPTNAIVMVATSLDANCRFGDNTTLDGTANNGYDYIKQDTTRAIPVAGESTINFLRDSTTDVRLIFSFEMAE